jgi:transposase-like protein
LTATIDPPRRTCCIVNYFYGRTLITRIGKLELRVPQDRAGRFSTELFERYQRSERVLVAVLAEMYVQVSRPAR